MADKNIVFDKLEITQDEVDDFRRMFGKDASQELMESFVRDFQDDFSSEIKENPNFLSPELLQSGKAGILDVLDPKYGRVFDEKFIPFRDMSLAKRKAVLSDPDEITSLITGVKTTSLPGAAFSEFVKTVPSVAAGKEAAALTARATLGRGISPNPYIAAGQVAAPISAFLAGSLLLYEGADLLEDALVGEADVVLPGQKVGFEVARTLGGHAAGAVLPFLLRKTGLSGSRNALQNLAEDASPTASQKFGAFIEDYLEKTARTAKGSKKGAALTVTGEAVAAPFVGAGAGIAETIAPESPVARITGEILGGNTFASTFGRLLAPGLRVAEERGLTESVSVEDLLARSVKKDEEKLFKRLNELYEINEGDYEALMNDLASEEVNSLLREVFPNVDFTAAQRLKDDTGIIMMTEARMAQERPELLAARAKADNQAREFFAKYIAGLTSEGSDASLQKAAKMRQAVISDMLRRRLQNAVEKRIDATTQVFKDPSTSKEVGPLKTFANDLANTYETALRFARNMNSGLWEKVPDTTVFTAEDAVNNGVIPTYIEAYDKIVDNLPQGFKQRWMRENSAIVENVKAMKKQLGLDLVEQKEAAQAAIDDVAKVDLGPQQTLYTQYETNFTDSMPNLSKITVYEDILEQVEEGKFSGPRTRRLEELAPDELEARQAAGFRGPETIDTTLSFDLNKEEQANYRKVLEAKIELLKIEDEITKLGDENPVTSKQLIQLRSKLLSDASNIASGKFAQRGLAQDAFEIGSLAEAVFDDLDSVNVGVNQAYDEARDFTKALHDVFTRSTIGRDRARTGQGGLRVPPEVIISKYIRNTPEATDLRVEELQNVAKFMQDRGLQSEFEETLETTVSNFTTIDNFISGFLRAAQRENVYAPGQSLGRGGADRQGQVNPAALASFRQKNQELLKRFPQLDRDLGDAVSAQRAFEFMEKNQEKIKKAYQTQKDLQTLIGHSSPMQALSDALNYKPKGSAQKDPVQGLNRLFKYVRGGEQFFRNPDGSIMSGADRKATLETYKNGFKDAVLNYVFMSSGGESPDTFDPVSMYKALFLPLGGQGKGKTSLMDIAKTNDIFSKQEIRQIRLVNEQMVRLAAADAAGKLMDPNLIETSGPIFDFYVGLVGLAGGSLAFKGLTGDATGVGSISAPMLGKRLVLDYLKELPAVAKMQALQMIFTEPDVVATLMKQPKTKEAAKKSESVMKNILMKKLFDTSLQASPFVIREMGEEVDTTVEPSEQQKLIDAAKKKLPIKDASVAPKPPVASPTTQAASAPPAFLPKIEPGGAAPVNFALASSLFPDDETFKLRAAQQTQRPPKFLRRGGIASLLE